MLWRRFLLFLLSACLTASAHARIGLVVGEPFGSFGTMLPVGHAGVYLDHVCAETPTRLRVCGPGESGVVISRYHDLKQTRTDWLAIPAFVFFYGVERAQDVPAFVTPQLRDAVRERYREEHLAAVVPLHTDRHGRVRSPLNGDWAEGIGAAFDRRLFLYVVDTTAEQDAAMIARLNAEADVRRYTLGRANCADFASDLLSEVVPGALHRSFFNDFDMTTPKTLARQMDAYGQAHPEVRLRVFVVPQLPGSIRRSRPVRGSAELFLTTKRYLLTLIVLQPEFVAADTVVYLSVGRWRPGADATLLRAEDWRPAPPL